MFIPPYGDALFCPMLISIAFRHTGYHRSLPYTICRKSGAGPEGPVDQAREPKSLAPRD